MLQQQCFRYLTMVVILSACSASAATYEVSGETIKRNGQVIQLFGVNWFGAETQDHVPHGLWSRNYR
ncbi:MAG: endoglucanase, partial [Myxococcota bacterium]